MKFLLLSLLLVRNNLNVLCFDTPRVVYHVPLSFKNLLNGIEKHDFDKIYFDTNLQRAISSKTDSDVFYDTDVSPIVATKIVDAALKYNIEPIFASRSLDVIPTLLNFAIPVFIFLFIHVFYLYKMLI